MLQSSCGSVPIALDRVPNVFYGGGLLFYFSARRSPRLTGQLANDPRVLAYVVYSAAQRAVASGKRRHGVSSEAPGHKARRRKGTKGLFFLLQHPELGTLTCMLQSSCGSVPIAFDWDFQ